MSAALEIPETEKPAAILRGGARGLEIVVDGTARLDAIVAAVEARIAEAPGFFRGSDVRVRVEDGPLPAGALGKLDELAAKFELRIVEVLAGKPGERLHEEPGERLRTMAVPQPQLAAGSAPCEPGTPSGRSAPIAIAAAPSAPAHPIAAFAATPSAAIATAATAPAMPAFSEAVDASPERGSDPQTVLPIVDPVKPAAAPKPEPTVDAPAEPPPSQDQLELALAALDDFELTITREASVPTPVAPPPPPPPEPKSKILLGPVRSGVILEHRGHLIIFGDVNPGAEVRAEGNIVVLGRLRGTAHAGIGNEAGGFILALRLEPQQLRIGRSVARASDSDTPGQVPEIAHMTGGAIIVERYLGRLPNGLAASI